MRKSKKKPTIKELLACRSVGAIVALMKRYGVTGDACSVDSCPLANYAKRAGIEVPLVTSDGQCETAGSLWNCDGKPVFRGSKVRSAFVRKFDLGQFPDPRPYRRASRIQRRCGRSETGRVHPQ